MTASALTVDPAVWSLFPAMEIVTVAAAGLDNAADRRMAALDARLTAAEEALRRGWSHANAQSHPAIAAWRRAAKAMAASTKKHPSSIEALTRRVLQGKALPRINPLVDLYNLISLSHLVPAGGWDRDDLHGALTLRQTAGGEPFHALGTASAVTVGAGEVSYLDEREVITRHFVWRQSERGKITPSTRAAILVSEILPPHPEGTSEQVRDALVEGIVEVFGVTPETAILGAP